MWYGIILDPFNIFAFKSDKAIIFPVNIFIIKSQGTVGAERSMAKEGKVIAIPS
jgi:hypothetical protein